MNHVWEEGGGWRWLCLELCTPLQLFHFTQNFPCIEYVFEIPDCPATFLKVEQSAGSGVSLTLATACTQPLRLRMPTPGGLLQNTQPPAATAHAICSARSYTGATQSVLPWGSTGAVLQLALACPESTSLNQELRYYKY